MIPTMEMDKDMSRINLKIRWENLNDGKRTFDGEVAFYGRIDVNNEIDIISKAHVRCIVKNITNK